MTRFAAILGTLDEASLLGTTIQQLRRIGVELIAVIDRGSTDGSLEILAEEERHGDVWVVQAPPEDAPHARGIWTGLAKASGAEWVLFLDSDELWLPRTGSLHDMRQLDHADLLYVPRYNTVLGTGGVHLPEPPTADRYADTLVYALGIPDAAAAIAADPTLPWILAEQDPKVLVRREILGDIARGAHDIVPIDDRPLRTWWAREVLIAHLPFTTEPRFARKMGNIEATLQRRPDLFQQNQGWQWSMWAELGSGRAREELDRQRIDALALGRLRDAGVVRSVEELLRPLVPEDASQLDGAVSLDAWMPAVQVVCLRHRVRPDGHVTIARWPGESGTGEADAAGEVGAAAALLVELPPDHRLLLLPPGAGTAGIGLDLAGDGSPTMVLVADGTLAEGWTYRLLAHTTSDATTSDAEASRAPAPTPDAVTAAPAGPVA